MLHNQIENGNGIFKKIAKGKKSNEYHTDESLS